MKLRISDSVYWTALERIGLPLLEGQQNPVNLYDLERARTYVLLNGTAPTMAAQQAVMVKEILMVDD